MKSGKRQKVAAELAATPWNWTALDQSAQSWPILKPLLRDNALDLLKGDKT